MFYFGLSHQEIAYQIAGLINDYNFLSKKRRVSDILQGRTHYILETHGNLVLGAIGWDKQSYTFTEIKHLIVRPEWRGKGIAKFLLLKALNISETKMLYATVREDNISSLQLFEKNGFRRAGVYVSNDHNVILLVRVSPKWEKKKPGLKSNWLTEIE